MMRSMKVSAVALSWLLFLAPCSLLAAESEDVDRSLRGNGMERYIVVLKKDAAGPPAEIAETILRKVAPQGAVGHVFQNTMRGFSVEVPANALQGLQRRPEVAYVEPDFDVEAFVQSVPTGIERAGVMDNVGLQDNIFSFPGGKAVDVGIAILDSGIDYSHPDLNVVGGINCASRRGCQGEGQDDDGHGTHCAGTAAARHNDAGVVGVAPGARLYAVKVLGRRGGQTSWIIGGIEWVVNHNLGASASERISVINMSLGGQFYSQAFQDAVTAAYEQGIAFAVAAGNSASDAQSFSPASFDNVLTVSALADFDGMAGGFGSPTCRDDQDDTLADFSNYGEKVDVIAPGVCILSTVPGGYDTYSGTSMASPHVAGGLALLASVRPPLNGADVLSLYNVITDQGTSDWDNIDDGDLIKEPLLDVSGFGATIVDSDGGNGGGGGGGGSCDANGTSCSKGSTSCCNTCCKLRAPGPGKPTFFYECC